MLWPEHLASCPRGNLLANVGDGSKVDVSECPADVRFGSKADIAAYPRNVRFVPKADQVRCSKKGQFSGGRFYYGSYQGFSRLDLSAARKRAASPPVTAR